MSGNKTILIDIDKNNEKRDFVFDFSYQSHNGFNVRADGYTQPDKGSDYADQRKVYNELGGSILDNAWKGYHCTLFAYGQTGSGKSYSVMGYGANKGIVPIACEEIFKRIDADKSGVVFEVLFGMMEIYNERV